MFRRLYTLNCVVLFVYAIWLKFSDYPSHSWRRFFESELGGAWRGETLWFWSPLWLLALRMVIRVVFRV